MATKEKTTNRTEKDVSKQSREVAIVETHPSELQAYSEELKAEIENQQNFLSVHATRLTNLIHSEVESLEAEYLAAESPDQRTQRLSEQSRESVLRLGSQLLETIKLGVAVAGVRMKIERGDV